jgi:hypothetical protein
LEPEMPPRLFPGPNGFSNALDAKIAGKQALRQRLYACPWMIPDCGRPYEKELLAFR